MFKLVSIIIPALNEEKNISKCLNALSELNLRNLDIEIIVVDNGSQDNTASIARGHGATVFVKPEINISGLRNYGALKSKGDLLAFVDADCIVDNDWMNEAVKTIALETADAVGSFHNILSEAGWIGRAAELVQSQKVGSEAKYIPSGNLIVKRSSFNAVKGFNEDLITSEDVDFCYRLKKSGYKIFLNPAIRSIHLGSPKNLREMLCREMWHGKSMLSVFIKDLKKVRNLRLVLYSTVNMLLILCVISGFFLLLAGWSNFLVVSFGLYLLLNFVIAIRDWKKIRKNMLSLFCYDIVYGFARSLSLFISLPRVFFNIIFR